MTRTWIIIGNSQKCLCSAPSTNKFLVLIYVLYFPSVWILNLLFTAANFIRVSLFKISGLFMDPSIGEIRIYYKVTRIIVIDKKVNQNSRLWIKEILLTTRKRPTNEWKYVTKEQLVSLTKRTLETETIL